jgi:hypothetical protein
VWENVGAYASEGTARFTITGWARSIVASGADVDLPLDDLSVVAGLVVLPAVAVAGWLLATWRYRSADVD